MRTAAGRRRLIAVALLSVIVSGCAAGRAYRRGQESARLGDWDAAVAHYTRALQESPQSTQFKIELERAMQNAAREHIGRARQLEESDQLDAALIAYKRALEMDASNRLAAARVQELERTIRDRIEKSRPKPPIDELRRQASARGTPTLNPASRVPLKFNFNQSSVRDILTWISSQTGINIQFDASFNDAALRPYSVTLDGVTVEEALHQILSVNTLFYKVINPTSIVVAPDNAAMHAKYDDLVLQVFYLSHIDANEMVQTLNTVMRIQTQVPPAVAANKTANTVTVRGSAAIVAVIEKLIRANDKPRAEVIVDVQILEVSRSRTKEFGINLSNYALGLTFSPEAAPPNTSGTVPPASPPPFNLNTISQGVSTADFYLTVPTAAVRFLEQDSQTKQIAKPQLRGAEGQKLTLNLGDDIPFVQSVFGAQGTGGLATTPISQYQYRSVGVNIEMTPRVSYSGEVLLDLYVESSSLGPRVDVGGQSAPSFGSRKVKTWLRLREGESTLLAGLLRDDQRKILSGLPGVTGLPILRNLFGATQDEVRQTDIVMLLTPHIVRTHELTVDDLSPIYIGTQQTIGLGGPPPLIAPLPDAEAGLAPAPAGATPTMPQVSPVPGPVAPIGGVQPGVGTVPPPGVISPGGVPPVPGVAPPTAPPIGTDPVVQPPLGVVDPAAVPPRDPAAVAPTAPPAATPPGATAQVLISTPGNEFRVAGGPYTVPLSVNNAARLSTMTMTVTFNPSVLRVRSVQEGTFMRQGGVTAAFTPRIDNAAGRVDIAVTRSGDAAGASGAGLLAALLFDAAGTGNSLIQVSGVASTPDGAPVPLQFTPVQVTVR